MEDNQPTDTQAQDGFERQLPDNTVEYLLFIVDDQLDARKLLTELEVVRKAAVQLSQTLAGGYIWQRDEFKVELKNETGEIDVELRVHDLS